MTQMLVTDGFVNSRGRIGGKRDPLQVKIGKGKSQGLLHQKMRAINGIALGTAIGIGLWGLVIAVFI